MKIKECFGLFLACATIAAATTITPKEPSLKDGCYQIGTAAELFGFAEISKQRSYDKSALLCAKLTADIVINKNVLDSNGNLNTKAQDLVSWVPILNFAGTFDGNGKTISGLYVNDTTTTFAGLFQSILTVTASDSTLIKDLGIKDSYFKAAYKGYSPQFTGSIFAGTSTNGGYTRISNCYSEATIEGRENTGGLVGRNSHKLIIENSHFSGKILTLANDNVGGLVGTSGNDTLFIFNSYNSGDIRGGSVGGLISATNVFHIKDSYNSGNLSSEHNNVAGLVLALSGPGSVPRTPLYSVLENSYNTGKLYTETSNIGGLIGSVSACELNIINSYSDGDFSWRYKGYGYDALVLGIADGEVNFISSFYTQQTFDSTTILKLYHSCNETSSCNVINSYALSESGYRYDYSVTSKELEDGSIALKLHNYKNDSIGVEGSIWGQNVGKDVHPLYTGEVEFNTVEVHITPTIPKLVDGCYQIGNADELYGFAAVVNGTDSTEAKLNVCGKLTDDIIVNERLIVGDTTINERGRRLAEWIPIEHFEGIFDGQGHSISGLYINQPRRDSTGFFGIVGRKDVVSEPVIKDVHIKDSYFNAQRIAGVVGWLHSSLTLSGISFEGFLEGDYVAGLLNSARELEYVHDPREYLSIKDCYSKAILKGRSSSTGLVGYVDLYNRVDIINSYNETNFISKMPLENPAGIINDLYRGRLNIINSYSINKLSYDFRASTKRIGMLNTIGSGSIYETQSLNIVNSYILLDESNSHVISGLVIRPTVETEISIKNSYYASDSTNIYGGIRANRGDFANGTIAAELHNYKKDGIDGSVWGQVVGTDPSPTLSGKITGYTPKIYALNLVTYEGDTAKYIDHFVQGHKVFPPKPVRDGYLFAGWFNNNKFDGDAVLSIGVKDTSDVTLYAKWIENKSLAPKGECFEIATAEDLYHFAHYVNDTTRENIKDDICAKLTADIVINKNVLTDPETLNEDAISFIEWTPIQKFHGTFDGQGHSISGLYYYDERISYVGLFASVDFGEQSWFLDDTTYISNLTLKDSYIHGHEKVAGIVANIMHAVVIMDNVHNESMIKGLNYVAGLNAVAEYNGYPKILNSSNAGTIYSKDGAGGLLVSNWKGTYISNSYNSGHIIASYGAAGLAVDISGNIFENANDYSLIEKSYNIGTISGSEGAGGLIGSCGNCRINQSANLGNVYGRTDVGGLIHKLSGEIYNSYNAGHIEAEYRLGGLVANANRVTIANSFNTQKIVDTTWQHGGIIGNNESYLEQNVSNSFFINSSPENLFQQIQVTAKDFADGTVLKALQDYTDSVIDGKCWIQNIGKDTHPVLKGMNIVAISSSSEKISSSSETPASSSSETIVSSSSETPKSSSSKETKSSSSVKETSSSSEKAVSSSSETPKSSSSKTTESSSSESGKSSSSEQPKSSSSEEPKSSSSGKTSIAEGIVLDIRYNLAVENRNIMITGVPANTYVALFDMNGTLVDWKLTESNGATLAAPRSGRYIVRVKAHNQSVIVK